MRVWAHRRAAGPEACVHAWSSRLVYSWAQEGGRECLTRAMNAPAALLEQKEAALWEASGPAAAGGGGKKRGAGMRGARPGVVRVKHREQEPRHGRTVR